MPGQTPARGLLGHIELDRVVLEEIPGPPTDERAIVPAKVTLRPAAKLARQPAPVRQDGRRLPHLLL
jgi:hypothetical protein